MDRLGPATPVSQAAGSWQLLAAVPNVLQSAGGSAPELNKLVAGASAPAMVAEGRRHGQIAWSLPPQCRR